VWIGLLVRLNQVIKRGGVIYGGDVEKRKVAVVVIPDFSEKEVVDKIVVFK